MSDFLSCIAGKTENECVQKIDQILYYHNCLLQQTSNWVNCVAQFIIVPFKWLNLLGHSGCP